MIAASADVYEQQSCPHLPAIPLMRDTPEGLEWVPVGGPQQASSAAAPP